MAKSFALRPCAIVPHTPELRYCPGAIVPYALRLRELGLSPRTRLTHRSRQAELARRSHDVHRGRRLRDPAPRAGTAAPFRRTQGRSTLPHPLTVVPIVHLRTGDNGRGCCCCWLRSTSCSSRRDGQDRRRLQPLERRSQPLALGGHGHHAQEGEGAGGAALVDSAAAERRTQRRGRAAATATPSMAAVWASAGGGPSRRERQAGSAGGSRGAAPWSARSRSCAPTCVCALYVACAVGSCLWRRWAAESRAERLPGDRTLHAPCPRPLARA